MSSSYQRTLELLRRLIASKKNLSDTLVSKGEEAEFSEPFDDLVQKAADYIPKSYIFVDENGNEIAGALVSQETVFDATENDVREGKVFASEVGVKTGTKFIPSYNTTEGYAYITPNSTFLIKSLSPRNLYDFTKLQAIICPLSNNISQSVSAEKVSIDSKVYEVNSNVVIAELTKDSENKYVNFGIKNDTENIYVLRYFIYKEIY